MENIPANDLVRWRSALREEKPSAVLRDIAKAYGVGRTELASMLGDLYTRFGTPEVQAVWQWDLAKRGAGLSDQALDEILMRLEPSQ